MTNEDIWARALKKPPVQEKPKKVKIRRAFPQKKAKQREFPVEHNILIPPPGRVNTKKFAQRKYPFDLLKVGDSFFVPLDDRLDKLGGLTLLQVSIKSAANKFASYHNNGHKHVTRVYRTDNPGVRCWRTK